MAKGLGDISGGATVKRVDIRNFPRELYAKVEADGKLCRESVAQALIRYAYERHYVGKKSAKHPQDGFVKPTLLEAQKEVKAKGYHFTAEEFIANGEANGWKLSNGNPMKDWKASMVTWESRRKEEQKPAEESSAGALEALEVAKAHVRSYGVGGTGAPPLDPRIEYALKRIGGRGALEGEVLRKNVANYSFLVRNFTAGYREWEKSAR